MFAWHTINFMMACDAPRLDELMNWLHERPGRIFTNLGTNLGLIQLGFMDPDNPEDDPAYAKKWQLRGIVYTSGKNYGCDSDCFYASDQDHGEPSTFWLVIFHSISSFRVGRLYTPRFLKLRGRKVSTKAGKNYGKMEYTPRLTPSLGKGIWMNYFLCVSRMNTCSFLLVRQGPEVLKKLFNSCSSSTSRHFELQMRVIACVRRWLTRLVLQMGMDPQGRCWN